MAQRLLTTPRDLLHYKLRIALTMEDDSLAALGELAAAASAKDVKAMFKHHAEETKEQIENLHSVFSLLEFNISSAPSPSTKGISKQAQSLLAKSAPELRDVVTLGSALGNEHFEIASYQGLIIETSATGADEAVQLLRANLDQEVHTSEELHSMLQKLVTG